MAKLDSSNTLLDNASKVLQQYSKSSKRIDLTEQYKSLSGKPDEQIKLLNDIIKQLKALKGSGDSKEISKVIKGLETYMQKLSDSMEDLVSIKNDVSKIREATRTGTSSVLVNKIVDGLKSKITDRAMQKKGEEKISEILGPALTSALNPTASESISFLGENDKTEVSAKFDKLFHGIDEILKLGASFVGALNNSYQDALSWLTQTTGSINSRLEGTSYNIKDLSNYVANIANGNPAFNTKEILTNIRELVSKGIANDLEEQAIIMSVGDKLYDGFKATSENILRLSRIQQQSTMTASLGIQTELKALFNELFLNTAYLTDAYVSVSDSLIDTLSQLSLDQASAVEYTIQKWLGGLYSQGVSQQAVESIATGLGYLGTGNVEALNSNSALTNLLALSAQRAGLNYADLILNPLEASSINTLMKSMVEYLKSVQENASNQVVASEYGKILGLSVADLRALANLDDARLAALYSAGNVDSFGTARNTVVGRLADPIYMESVFTLQEQFENLKQNFLYDYGMTLANSDAAYMAFMLSDVVDTIGNITSSATMKAISGVIKGITGVIGLGDTIKDFVTSFRLSNRDWFIKSSLLDEIFGTTGAYTPGAVISGTSYGYNTQTGETPAELDRNKPYLSVQRDEYGNVISQESSGTLAYDINDLYAGLFMEKQHITVDVANFLGWNSQGYYEWNSKALEDAINNTKEITVTEPQNGLQTGAIPTGSMGTVRDDGTFTYTMHG